MYSKATSHIILQCNETLLDVSQSKRIAAIARWHVLHYAYHVKTERVGGRRDMEAEYGGLCGVESPEVCSQSFRYFSPLFRAD